MRRTKKCSVNTIQKILNNFFDEKDLLRKSWIAKEEDGSWIAIDNRTGDCWTEVFDSEFAARLWLECEKYDAEYIRGY